MSGEKVELEATVTFRYTADRDNYPNAHSIEAMCMVDKLGWLGDTESLLEIIASAPDYTITVRPAPETKV